MAILHIFNGDCLCNLWKKHGSAYLVWRENYLDGPLPPPETAPEDFAGTRAEFLHAFYAPDTNLEQLKKSLLEMENTVKSLSAGDIAILWFDECMYDQLMLSRILFLMREPISKIMEMRFENEHRSNCRSSVEGATCKVTPDTALRQVDDGRFKARFQDF